MVQKQLACDNILRSERKFARRTVDLAISPPSMEKEDIAQALLSEIVATFPDQRIGRFMLDRILEPRLQKNGDHWILGRCFGGFVAIWLVLRYKRRFFTPAYDNDVLRPAGRIVRLLDHLALICMTRGHLDLTEALIPDLSKMRYLARASAQAPSSVSCLRGKWRICRNLTKYSWRYGQKTQNSTFESSISFGYISW